MTTSPNDDLPFGLPLPAVPPRRALDLALNPDGSAARVFEVGIPMRDSVELAASVHLPAAAALPAPAVVIGTPYDKSSPAEQVGHLQDAGYAAVVYDTRGRGKSEGEWNPWMTAAPDGHDVVEWVGSRPWCSGDVGVTGISYGGFVVWATMSERPAHLRAATSFAAAGRFMQEDPYTYGCLWLYYVHWFAAVRRRINDRSREVGELLKTLPVRSIGETLDPVGPGWEEHMDHDTLDEKWAALRWDGAYDFLVPCLHLAGWYDRENISGAFHHYEEALAGSPAADRQWLIVGPWSHGSTRFPDDGYRGVDAPDGALDVNAIQLRFFDRFLKGRDDVELEEEARVRLYDTGAGRWRVRDGWREGTGEARFYLGPDLRLEREEIGEGGSETYRYEPLDPSGLEFDLDAYLWEPPVDLSSFQDHAGVRTWVGAPLQVPLTLRGWGSVELWAETDGEDTDWHVKLVDIGLDGRPFLLSWGCLRAACRESLTDPRPVPAGRALKYTIELTPRFHTLAIGHRLGLSVSSSDFPWYARNLNQPGRIADQETPRIAHNTIHFGGAMASRIDLSCEPR